ncbi:MAG TPA: VWA domain-containing protein, partial [Candidatus Sulfotelmatobacter sp.]|nr:VWA domain-containing protein [Candidatus Sulfotelmatobacter sp.]
LHARKLRHGDTFFLILSDGLDTGEPEALAAELRAVKRRVRKLVWLNPLLALPDYQPIAQGMSAALPHVDVFAPAHNLESLLALEKHL